MTTKIDLELDCSPDELQEALGTADRGNKEPLRALCRKEVDRFETYLRSFGAQAKNHVDRDWIHGLSKWERGVLEGYLYQKIRGHIDETTSQDHAGSGRHDGTPASP